MSYQKYPKKQNKTILEIALIGIMRALWFLIKLPFKGLGGRKVISIAEKNEITAKRHEIENLLSNNNEIELKHAVMEADKLVDRALKLKGFEGDTFADRLRSAERSMDRNIYQNIWQGHKVRNRIAHEPGAISQNELRNAVNDLLRYVRNI
ncbi:MAG: hypothetical protein M1324_02895 [Patescibacteria group bacterium]|nr:hypothetical protein [Patescibacteria group bacterium]